MSPHTHRTTPRAPKKKIAVMTSGGDAPGMNGAVRAIVRTTIHMGCDSYCVYEGYDGLVKGGDYIRKMGWQDVRGWLSEGGTLIGTARCKAFFERPGRMQAAKNMILHGIDALIICGGDGSLTGADKFRGEWPGLLEELVSNGELTAEQIAPYKHLNIVGIVGSIDNDLAGTDSTIGCYTALECISDMVSRLETTARSHQRAFVIEVMGRHCGWLALMAGVAVGADFICIPEKPAVDWQAEMRDVVRKNRELGKRKTIVIVAEGALDVEGNKITTKMVETFLTEDLGIESRTSNPGHSQRGGPPVAYDRLISTLQGVEAVKAVLEATPDSETNYIAIVENKIVRKPLMKAVQDTKDAAKAIAEKKFDLAMSLRDSEFEEQYKSFHITTNVIVPEDEKLPIKDRMRIGLINVGAPAGGVNAALRAATAYCLRQGHTPIAIYNGFTGFVRHHADKPLGSVRELEWAEVDEWAANGGSQIGTNRHLPDDSDVGMENVADLFEKYKFDALIIVGGFEAFVALSQLRKARDKFPSLCIPLVLLPAGISNNIPGTEWSIGSDTALNNLVAYCDTINQSASSSRRRVFVVETQGGRCGYLATIGGLAVGAMAVYTPEEGMHLDMLFSDIKHLTHYFGKEHGESRGGRIVLINEKASNVYNAEMISHIIEDEARGRFSSRFATPGHFQQGNRPSGLDRCRAVRLAIKCIERLEAYGHCAHNKVKADPVSASVIGIQGSGVVFTPVQTLEEEDTNWKDRCSKSIPWMAHKEVVDSLGGRPTYPRR